MPALAIITNDWQLVAKTEVKNRMGEGVAMTSPREPKEEAPFGLLSLQCLGDIQMSRSRKKLDMCIWASEEKSGLQVVNVRDIHIERSEVQQTVSQ